MPTKICQNHYIFLFYRSKTEESNSDKLKSVNKPRLEEQEKEESKGKEPDPACNVYLQERPSFDLFKAIFENEDENQEEEEEIEDEVDNDVQELDPTNKDDVVHIDERGQIQDKIGQIESTSRKDLNKYLEVPEIAKFTQLVKSLAATKEELSSESSSSQDDDEDVQIVYEEVSISPANQKHKKKKSSKKKKKKSKKKSKKSHKSD